MKEKYRKEYLELLNKIKENLDNLYPLKQIINKFLKQINLIESSINDSSLEEDYLKAIARLLYIQEQIKYYDHTLEDNYIEYDFRGSSQAKKGEEVTLKSIDYQKEYLDLLDRVTIILDSTLLPIKIKNKYLKYVALITKNIANSGKEEDYLKALTHLSYIYSQIKYFDNEEAGNYIEYNFKDEDECAYSKQDKAWLKFVLGTIEAAQEMVLNEDCEFDLSNIGFIREKSKKNTNWLQVVLGDFKDIERLANEMFSENISFPLIKKEEDTKEKEFERKAEQQARMDRIFLEIQANVAGRIDSEASRHEFIPKDLLDLLSNKISKIQSEIDLTSSLVNKSKQKVITYLTILSILITFPIASVIRTKNSRELLYKTDKEIHSSVDKDIDPLMYKGLHAMGLDDIPTYKSVYEPLAPKEEMVTIKKYSPWVTYGNESKRKVITYNIEGIEFETLLSVEDMDEFTKDMNGEPSYEYKYRKDLTKKEREYPDEIYEIIKSIQDISTYIHGDIPKEAYIKLIITLLGELLVCLCMIEFTNGLLIEHIIVEIQAIIKNNKLNEQELAELEELMAKYKSISGSDYTPPKKKVRDKAKEEYIPKH